MLRCARCQQENDDESRFCKRCGAALDVSSKPALSPPASGGRASGLEDTDDTLLLRLFDQRPEVAVERRVSIWLLDPSGEQVVQATDLKDEVTVIGRRPECAIILPSNTVSRRHAQVRRDGAQFFLMDLNSTNGTLLNREPVIGEELLHDRDEIGVGIYRLIFRYS